MDDSPWTATSGQTGMPYFCVYQYFSEQRNLSKDQREKKRRLFRAFWAAILGPWKLVNIRRYLQKALSIMRSSVCFCPTYDSFIIMQINSKNVHASFF